MKAIQIEAYGNPAEVLKLVDLPDVGAPAAGEGRGGFIDRLQQQRSAHVRLCSQ